MKARIWLISFLCFLGAVIFIVDNDLGDGLFRFMNYVPGGDKTGHFLLMGTLCLLMNLWLNHRVLRISGFALLFGTLITIGLVTVEEFSQIFVKSRTFDLIDLAADYLGIIAFDFIARLIKKRKDIRSMKPHGVS
jgi:VanZ family protein